MDKTELLEKLTDDLQPVRWLPSFALRVMSWVIIAIVFTVVGVLFTGMRGDISQLTSDPRFLFESLAILTAGVTSGIIALILAEPGKQTKLYARLGFSAACVWFISILVAFILQFDVFSVSRGLNPRGFVCSSEVLVFSIIPALFLIGLIRLGSTMYSKLSGALILVSAGCIGMFALQFTCASEEPLHLMSYHVIPVVALGLIGWWSGQKLCGFEEKLAKKKKQIFDS